jgi:hypothetical protein
MKKLLVLLVSAALVLSMAAVSFAAATVKGDFRYDMYQDESSLSGDESWAQTDLRLNVAGDLSDSLSASATFQLKHGKDGVQGTSNQWDMNEYFVTYKEAWGSVKAGYYEYKFTPSRLLLKSAGKHVWDKVDVLVAGTFKTPVEGLTADVMVQPYAQKGINSDAYGVSVAYNTANWGAKATYADFKNDQDLTAIDAYYMINDTMKVFVDAVDYSGNDAGTVYDGLDPVIGFSWDKIAGSKVFAGIEYAINARNDGLATEFNEYTINVKYAFNNKTGLEIEHYQVADSQLKDIVRLRYQF